MATNNTNTSINKEASLGNIIISNFSELTKDTQKLLITSYTDEKNKGWFDKVFGTKKVAIYISLIICICLFLVGTIITIVELHINGNLNYEIWERIFPIITLILGYIFGKNPQTGE